MQIGSEPLIHQTDGVRQSTYGEATASDQIAFRIAATLPEDTTPVLCEK